jgi:hypothetical protein
METEPVSKTLSSLVFSISDDEQTAKNVNIIKVIILTICLHTNTPPQKKT